MDYISQTFADTLSEEDTLPDTVLMSLDSKVKRRPSVRLSCLEAVMSKCKLPNLYVLDDMTMI